MSFNYAVTAYKPTAITAALTGNFTGPNDLNLIQAKGTYLVVNLVTPEGLKPVVDVNIYGRITIMQLFRPRVLTVLNNAHVLEPIYPNLVPRPHPLTRRIGLVNQVEFLGQWAL